MHFIGEYFETNFMRILNDSGQNGADAILLHALLFVGLRKYGESLKYLPFNSNVPTSLLCS